MDFKSLTKSLNMSTLTKLTSAQSTQDLNVFLEKLPYNAGQTVLIAAGIAWGAAAALGLLTMVKVQDLTELRAKLKEAQALSPSVPKITETAVSKDNVDKFVAEFKEAYKGLDIKQSGSGLTITSSRTSNFAEFRESLGHVQNGGAGWRVSLDKLCVGRECDKTHKLAVALSIKQVSVENPNK